MSSDTCARQIGLKYKYTYVYVHMLNQLTKTI